MAIMKRRLVDFEEEEYLLIAINTACKEDHKVVYFINSVLNLHLERNKEDVDFYTDAGHAFFAFFEYEDLDHHVSWKVVANKAFLIPESGLDSPLFVSANYPVTKQAYLLPECKTIDYFIKIEEADASFDLGTIVDKLNSIKLITTAYEVKQEGLKNKKNLIF